MKKTMTGRSVLIWLCGFFGIILATNVVFIVLAIVTFSGEDEQKPYLQGIEYNQTLARRAEQAHLGWHATIAGHRLASGVVTIDVTLAGADGSAERGLALVAELRHPADEYRDRMIRFHEISAGHYRGEAANITAGQWDVVLTSSGKAPFEASRRLWLS